MQHLVAQPVQRHDQSMHDENRVLKAEIELVKALLRDKKLLLAEKDKRKDDLKHTLLLTESKLPKTPEPATPVATKKSWLFWRKKLVEPL